MYYESLGSVSPSIYKYLKRNPRSRLTTIYKYFRRSPRISLVGDYPLISEIIACAYSFGRRFTPNAVVKVFKLTSDPQITRCRSNSVLVRNLIKEAELESAETA